MWPRARKPFRLCNGPNFSGRSNNWTEKRHLWSFKHTHQKVGLRGRLSEVLLNVLGLVGDHANKGVQLDDRHTQVDQIHLVTQQSPQSGKEIWRKTQSLVKNRFKELIKAANRYPCIHPCIHSCIHPCIHPSMHPSIYPSICPHLWPSRWNCCLLQDTCVSAEEFLFFSAPVCPSLGPSAKSEAGTKRGWQTAGWWPRLWGSPATRPPPIEHLQGWWWCYLH